MEREKWDDFKKQKEKEWSNVEDWTKLDMEYIRVDLVTKEELKKGGTISGETKYLNPLKYFNEILKNDPQNRDAWLHKGEIYERLYETLSNSNIDNEYIKYEIIEPFGLKALDCYEKALEIDKNYEKTYRTIFRLIKKAGYEGRGRFLEIYDYLLKIEPENDEFFCYKMMELLDMEKEKEVLTLANEGIKKYPFSIWGYLYKASFYEPEESLRIIQEYFDKMLTDFDSKKLDEKYIEHIEIGLDFLGDTMSDLGYEDKEIAEKILEYRQSLLEKFPDTVELWITLAKEYRFKNPDYIPIFKKILELDPENTYALNGLGECYFIEKNYEEAKKYFYEVLNSIKEKNEDYQKIKSRIQVIEAYLLAKEENEANIKLLKEEIEEQRLKNENLRFESVLLKRAMKNMNDFNLEEGEKAFRSTIDKYSNDSKKYLFEIKKYPDLWRQIIESETFFLKNLDSTFYRSDLSNLSLDYFRIIENFLYLKITAIGKGESVPLRNENVEIGGKKWKNLTIGNYIYYIDTKKEIFLKNKLKWNETKKKLEEYKEWRNMYTHRERLKDPSLLHKIRERTIELIIDLIDALKDSKA